MTAWLIGIANAVIQEYTKESLKWILRKLYSFATATLAEKNSR
jgi:hypothetical protein